ncbi:hypothetical protein NP570_23590, partial [Vibrio parahaemolyticus]|nr:hypothetical protein [Vibrio parahaemolyticus]
VVGCVVGFVVFGFVWCGCLVLLVFVVCVWLCFLGVGVVLLVLVGGGVGLLLWYSGNAVLCRGVDVWLGAVRWRVVGAGGGE